MKYGSITGKLFAIAVIGGVCFVASLLVLGLVNERQERYGEATKAIAENWSRKQTLIGPMIISSRPGEKETIDTYILPNTLRYETTLEPEVRSRGIFQSIVYTSVINVSGEFSADDIRQATVNPRTALFTVVITDTRGIEQQVALTFGDATIAFEPGAGVSFKEFQLQNSSGIHARVPIDPNRPSVPFSFTVRLKGSEGIAVAPLGKETILTIASSWPTPKFVGAFLPATRSITSEGFTSEWRISSFGRPYPQTWQGGAVDLGAVFDSAAGVLLHEQIDAYDLVMRSVKYAILFIIITFAAFFLFDVLGKRRVHAIQYLLIGSAIALFYVLLLSLSEHVGFLGAYLIATGLTVTLISAYSSFVLRSVRHALPILLLLSLLYGFLYFVLQLEDYALLFGSLLLFVFLAVIMFATRNIDWYAVDKPGEDQRGNPLP